MLESCLLMIFLNEINDQTRGKPFHWFEFAKTSLKETSI